MDTSQGDRGSDGEHSDTDPGNDTNQPIFDAPQDVSLDLSTRKRTYADTLEPIFELPPPTTYTTSETAMDLNTENGSLHHTFAPTLSQNTAHCLAPSNMTDSSPELECEAPVMTPQKRMLATQCTEQFIAPKKRWVAAYEAEIAEPAKESATESVPTNVWRLRQTGGGEAIESSQEDDSLKITAVLASTPAPPQRSKRLRRDVYTAYYNVSHKLSNHVHDLAAMEEKITAVFKEMLQPMLTDAKDEDLVSVVINHDSFTKGPVYVNFMQKGSLDYGRFFERIEKINQSNSEFLLTGLLRLQVAILKPVDGQHYILSGPPMTIEDRMASKRVIVIKNKDNACGYLAIALAVLRSKQLESLEAKQRYAAARKQTSFLRIIAEQLCDACGVAYEVSCNRSNLDKIQAHLEDYQIIVIERPTQQDFRCNLLYRGPDKVKKIVLEHTMECLNDETHEHYNIIPKVAGYFDKQFWCWSCLSGSISAERHNCSAICTKCKSSPACNITIEFVECELCNESFFGAECLNNHEKKLCKKFKKCIKCFYRYNARTKHVCESYYCQKCGITYSDSPHHCYLKPLNLEEMKKQDSVNKIIIAYDIEASQDNENANHVANILISHTVCDECYNWDTHQKRKKVCSFCGELEKIYTGTSCVKDFCDYVCRTLAHFSHVKKAKSKIYAYAHNFKGYDSRFILRYLWEQNFIDLKMIMQGTKLIKIRVGSVNFLDTLSLFQQRLADLPDTFNFSDDVKKGYFGHLFNKDENWNYVGDLPPIECFSVNSLKPNEAAKLVQWHAIESAKSEAFVFKEQILDYCRDDVRIVLRALQEFRKEFKKIAQYDPITRCLTLPSAALEYFRVHCLETKTLGITPIDGYSSKRTHSKVGDIWLDWLEHSNSALTLKREQRIGKYFVDSLQKESRNVYEFNGCWYHGCPICFPNKRDKKIHYNRSKESDSNLKELSMNNVFLKYQKKLTILEGLKYSVNTIWEHEYHHVLKSNAQMKDFHNNRLRYYNALEAEDGYCNIKHAVFGGRTNNTDFQIDLKDGQTLQHRDVCSLYPSVLYDNEYPIGHAVVIRSNFDLTLDSYFGFVSCVIQPPDNLWLPVLPKKYRKKLMFVLCDKCAEEEASTYCSHSKDQRNLKGSWTTAELKLALKYGYIIQKIYEVLHYPKRDRNIFKSYIKTFLKVKTESSGTPKFVKNDADLDRYTQEFFEHEDVLLEKENIRSNSGRRAIAKLLLNSLWGKLMQNPNQTQTVVCSNHDDLWKIMSDTKLEVTGDIIINDDTVLLSYVFANDSDSSPGNTSLAVAAFVTSYARCELYRHMMDAEKIRPRSVKYFDTDSIFYVKHKSDPDIPTGPYLGQMTDEILSATNISTAFCCQAVFCGPKNYAYRIVDEDGNVLKTVIKLKGITLSKEALETITFEGMSLAVKTFQESGSQPLIPVKQTRIVSDKLQNLTTQCFTKNFRVVSNKRIRLEGSTVPFGFRGSSNKMEI